MLDALGQFFGAAAATGGAIWLFQKYLIGRIKFDFDRKLEELKPSTAEQTLRRQNFLNSKREAFFDSLSVVNRYLESVPWSGPDIPEDRIVMETRPSEAEVNTCLAKLAMYADDPEIPEAFLACFGGASPVSLGEFVAKLRKDLGYGDLPWRPEDYKRFFNRDPGE